MADIIQLTSDALSLPLDDRNRLARQLWASLPAPPEAGEDEAIALDMAERRDAEFESGSIKGVVPVEAAEKARKSLGCE